ncbi:hypothetical protein ABH926_008784 [Catenulispora sp. GP43]|uniref:PIN domain-containing protein n=1 Tax=Catenulispora sp. GP43 TaxID=3156263 RepID=UPI0035166EA1
MTFLLRRGSTPQQALSALDEALTKLSNSVGFFPSSPAATYVTAVSDVEAHLGNAFDRQWVAETLFTPRYWHLLGVAHTTLPGPEFGRFSTSDEQEQDEFERRQRVEVTRIGPANNAADHERRLQMERLEHTREDVQKLETFANGGGKILIIDTNTLMHAYPLEQIQWQKKNGMPAHEILRVLVPLAVIDELDRKKFEGGDTMRRKAAAAIRSLYGHRKGLNPDVSATLTTTDGMTLTLEIPRDDLGRSRAAATDDEIRDFGVFVKEITGRPVTVVTRDMGLQLRCERAGLDVLWLHEDDWKQQEQSASKTK